MVYYIPEGGLFPGIFGAQERGPRVPPDGTTLQPPLPTV